MISIFSRYKKYQSARMARGVGYVAMFALVFSVSGWSLAASKNDDEPEVMVSIRPLALITSALMEGVGEPGILIEDGASPHHYALKPSSMKRLMQARLVVWVGPDLERFLEKPLSRSTAQTLAIGEQSNGSQEDMHGDEHEKEHVDDHGHDHGHDHDDHGDVDLHPWMDPEKAGMIARRISAALSQLYPNQSEQLQANLERFEDSLESADKQIAQRLEPLRERGFYVFHDAYGGFVEHYGLTQLGYFTLNPSQKPGARHLAEIRKQLEAAQAVCVLSEPQYSNALVDAITDGLPLKQGEIDPLAIGAELGPDAYTSYLLDLAGRFESCLSR